jgi:hypothetical protein
MDVNKLTISAITSSLSSVALLTSKEARQLYRQTGKCVRYKSQEHYIKNCNLAPANAASSKVTISAINDNDSCIYDSNDFNDSNGAAIFKRPDIN